MGNRLKLKAACPGLIVTSPAIRAQTTATLIANELGLLLTKIEANEQIYGAHLSELLTAVRSIDNQYRQVMLVGHNPGITDLVNHLTGYLTHNLPTCSITTLEFETDDWDAIERVEARLLDHDFPEKR